MGHDVVGSPFSWLVEKWRLLSIAGNSEGNIQLTEENLTAQYKLGASGVTFRNRFVKSPSGFSFPSSGSTVSTSSLASDDASKGYHRSTDRPFGANRWPYVVSSFCFSTGKHLCKAKLIGNIQEGFSFGIISSNQGSHGTLAKLGN